MKKLTIVGLVLVLILGLNLAILAAPNGKSKEVTVTETVVQEQYWGDGTFVQKIGPNDFTYTCDLSGNRVLHCNKEYSPGVIGLTGSNFILVRRGKSNTWEMRTGEIHYTSPYSGLPIKERWEGSVEIEKKDDGTYEIVDGVQRQYGYTTKYPTYYEEYAKSVAGNGLWLLAYHIYKYQ